MLLSSPGMAVELGEIQMESALGQPLRASIAYALAPNERINEQCVYLRSGVPMAGVPEITRATIALNGQRILLSGNTALREPMMSLQLAIDCPYTARLSREYVLLLNPPGTVEQPTVSAQPITATTARSATATAPRPATATRRSLTPPSTARSTAPAVVAGDRYDVMPGDTLSGIVARIENRKLRLWDSVDAIHAANPEAFLDNNIDRLIAGSTLVIPTSVADAVVSAVPAEQVAAAQPATTRAYRGVVEGAATTSPAPVATQMTEAASNPTPVSQSLVDSTLNAADIAPATNPITIATETQADAEPTLTNTQAAAAPTVSIPDTRIVQRQPVSAPVVITPADDSAQSWLVWLGVAGVGMFLGLLLFGRRLRERFGHKPDMDETQINESLLNRRSADRGEETVNDELGLTDATPRSADYQLDADLSDGKGFDSNDDIDVALDYNFATSGNYSNELDLTVGESEGDSDELPTDVMEKQDSSADTMEFSGTGYDMSMVVDVSKQKFESSATTRDLQAIQVESVNASQISAGPLDLTTEFDHRILEQDYEDEMTATQILNNEIEQAARELQARLSEFKEDPNSVSMAEDLEGTAEITAEMPARRPADNDSPATSGELSADDSMTALLPSNGDDDFDLEIDMDMDTAVHNRKSNAG
ncbi:MAG: hypothetical protein RIA65_00600 [Woeseia sp.]